MDHLPEARGFWRCHRQREWAAGFAYATGGLGRSFSFDDSMHAGTRRGEVSECARDPRRYGPTYPGEGQGSSTSEGLAAWQSVTS